jgi:hypothetical protein
VNHQVCPHHPLMFSGPLFHWCELVVGANDFLCVAGGALYVGMTMCCRPFS